MMFRKKKNNVLKSLSMSFLLTSLCSFASAEKLPDKGLVVHEWGSFAVAQDHEGAIIDGLNDNRNDLPEWVYVWPKNVPPLRGPRIMKKPILYFYTNEDQLMVNVKVGNPHGIFTQWWPQIGKITPRNYTEGMPLVNGMIEWENVYVLNKLKEGAKAIQLPDVKKHPWWSIARDTDSAVVRVSTGSLKRKLEDEKFLFYRGTNNYRSPISVKFEEGKLVVSNTGNQACSPVFLVHIEKDQKYFAHIPTIAAGETIVKAMADQKDPHKVESFEEARSLFKKEVLKQGLFEKEAEGMTKIWQDSYFNKAGLRAIHFCSPIEIEQLLPLTITPKPVETKRVIAVHVESMTASRKEFLAEQAELLGSPEFAIRERAKKALMSSGLYELPVLREIYRRSNHPEIKKRLGEIIKNAELQFERP